AYAMTGWRLGYAVGPEPIIKQMLKVHQFAIMCAPSVSQYAAITALKFCDDAIEEMKTEYNMRRKLIVDGLNSLGLTCFDPQGAFYVFPCIKSTGLSSEDFCQKLLFSQKVAIVPGTAFGASGEGYARISYSYSIKHILEALERIKKFMDTL
ncbi:MAG: aminotransferase class I/II-fold pyridoxal phosphate-dependent enzyme, partial [Oscillospiraceae bacterium]